MGYTEDIIFINEKTIDIAELSDDYGEGESSNE